MILSSLIVVLTLTPPEKCFGLGQYTVYTSAASNCDFHSSLKYVARLPELVKLIWMKAASASLRLTLVLCPS